jgi:hypothetical protein
MELRIADYRSNLKKINIQLTRRISHNQTKTFDLDFLHQQVLNTVSAETESPDLNLDLQTKQKNRSWE